MVDKEIVFQKNSVNGVINSYDILVFGDPVGEARRKTTNPNGFKNPKVSWVLHLKGSDRVKEFSSVKLVRSHILHGLVTGRWGSDVKHR